MAKFLDLSGVSHLWSKAKAYFAAKEDLNELSGKVDDIVAEGGEPNVITAVKVNGTAQTVGSDKSVNITVPTKTSQITNDSKYQTDTQVAAAVQAAISATGHASFEKVDTVPTAATAEENVLYLVLNSKTGHYDIYAFVGETVELIDDTTVDLSNYVEKETGKGLSANDYTDEEKAKLGELEALPDATGKEAGSYLVTTPLGMAWSDPVENYNHPTYTAKASGLYKVTVDALGHISAATAVTKSDITALGIPSSDTTYEAISTAEIDEICV